MKDVGGIVGSSWFTVERCENEGDVTSEIKSNMFNGKYEC